MNTSRSLSHVNERSFRWIHGIAYPLVLAWALFWATFVVLSSASEGLTSFPYAVFFLIVLAGTVIVVRRSFFAGALLLLAIGTFSLIFFSSSSAHLWFAGPPFLLGMLFLLPARSRVRHF